MSYRIDRLKYIILSLFNNLIKVIIPYPTVADTIEKIIKYGGSVSRYGEGKFKLMRGQNLLF